MKNANITRPENSIIKKTNIKSFKQNKTYDVNKYLMIDVSETIANDSE